MGDKLARTAIISIIEFTCNYHHIQSLSMMLSIHGHTLDKIGKISTLKSYVLAQYASSSFLQTITRKNDQLLIASNYLLEN